jgi:hypothetical protein
MSDTADLLARTPAVVEALLSGLPDSWTATGDTAGGWTPRDVVGHLISAEIDDFRPRIERILEHGLDLPFDAFDRFAHVDRDAGMPLDDLVVRFSSLRRDNLAWLAATVTDADLARRGRHPTLGEVTLGQLLTTWAVHDLDHIAQVFAGLAGSHDADVGPWKTYMGILLRRDDPAAVAG